METYFDPTTNSLRLVANLGIRLALNREGVFVTPNTLPGTSGGFTSPFRLPMLDAALVETCGAWLRQIAWNSGNVALWVFYLSLSSVSTAKRRGTLIFRRNGQVQATRGQALICLWN